MKPLLLLVLALSRAVEGHIVHHDPARRFSYGAIRFLDGTYSSFRFIRGGAPPSPGALETMRALVPSWTSS